MAREIYIKAGERYTVDKVLDIALRQDIGQDSSYSRIKRTEEKIDTKLSIWDFEYDIKWSQKDPETRQIEFWSEELQCIQSIWYQGPNRRSEAGSEFEIHLQTDGKVGANQS